MIYEIKNGRIKAGIDTHGAELKFCELDGVNYVYDGDKKWWDDTAPMLFPICGRLPEKKYSYGGRVYDMNIHGFAPSSDFKVVSASEDKLVLSLSASEETLKAYPFEFVYTAEFSVKEDTLFLDIKVENTGKDTLPYMIGWHPGFNLFGDGEINSFSLKFNAGETLDLHPILPGCFVQKEGIEFPAPGGSYTLNEEQIYTNDTVIFTRTGGYAYLSSPDTDRALEMRYSDNLPYFCIWKETDSRARFVCLEPWSDIPESGVAPVAFETRSMSRLGAGESQVYSYSVRLI